MKIIIITQDAPLYLPQFLDGFLFLLGKTPHTAERMVVFPSISKTGVIGKIKEYYNYYGLIDFFRLSVIIFKDKLLSLFAGAFSVSRVHSVDNVIRKYKINLYKTTSVNSAEFTDYIKNNNIDLIISIACPKIIKKELLNAPKKGCINYHTALLPRYRGRQPLFWALLNGEGEVGISVHEMDENIDNGPIIVQYKVPVGGADSLNSLYLKTIKIGPQALIDALDYLDKDSPVRIFNDPALSTYNSFPAKSDVKLFRARGKKFF